MDWLNLHIPTVLRSAEFIGSEPVDRSTHVMLLAFCAFQENGGIIQGCRDWKDRKWQQIAAVTREEVKRECDLWTWNGDDLHVNFYPAEKEVIVKAKRELARENGRKRIPKETNIGSNIGSNPEPKQDRFAKAEGEGEGEGEGERKEKGSGSSGGIEKMPSQQAFELCDLHPSRDKSQPALRAALGAIQRHGFEVVREGVRGYRAKVEEWTPAERAQYVKNAPEFFADDLWNKPAENWKGRTEARRTNGATVRDIDVGGRKPAGVMTAHLK